MIETSELKNFAFFQDFSESHVGALAVIGTPSQWMEGEILFHAGAPAKHLFILTSGMMLLFFPDGRSVPVQDEGHAIGWSSFVSPFRYTATAMCLTDVTLYQFSAGDVFRLIQMDADFGRHLMEKIAQIKEERRSYRQKKPPREL